MSVENMPIIIVGAGLSGLAAALELESQNKTCLIIEQNAKVGGKVQTDFVEDSYFLDHGFQVFLPAYPALKKWLPLLNLQLKPFKAGAILNVQGNLTRVGDPLRHPETFFETAFKNYGTLKDKLLILKLKNEVLNKTAENLLNSSQQSSLDYLIQYGFSEKMISNFWFPFFSGIFLETQLQTRAGFLLFLYKMFSENPVAVPAQGVGELPQKMAALLKKTEIIFNTEVIEVKADEVVLKNNKKIQGARVIDTRPTQKSWGSVTTLYYAAPVSPIDGAWLYLNSKANKYLVNHVAVMTEVSKAYTTKNDSLISVNVIQGSVSNSEQQKINNELFEMFGSQTEHWKFIKSYSIPQALPLYLQSNPSAQLSETPSQQGAFDRGALLAH